ncbi:MAG: hydrogenase maturation protease [Anaerolineae bacterium]|nr:hydrogenase maturation protease [Anaerolineae bacterium]
MSSDGTESPDQQAQHVLVIGYGNTLRGDDGIGRYVVGHLAQTIRAGAARVISCQQLTIDLAELIYRFGFVILVDACEGGVPGTFTCQEVRLETDTPPSLLHHMQPSSLLACSQALYGATPRMVLLTVVGAVFDYGEGLSPVLQQILPDILVRIESLVYDWVTMGPAALDGDLCSGPDES